MQQFKCSRAPITKAEFGGLMQDYLKGVTEQWLLIAPGANPAMLEMFRDRDRQPLRDMVPWAGEFAGKYLTSAVQVLRLTGDPRLKDFIGTFVAELVALQADDGYLGPWPAEHALTNHAPNCMQGLATWDTWGHYHIMLGLLLWHEDTGDAKALNCARRMGDLLCEKYLGSKSPRMVETPHTEMNLAPAHSLVLLHKATDESRYLELAQQIVEEFAALDGDGKPLAGNYLDGPLAGLEFFELPKPRWESLHPIMALSELYTITGKQEYRQALEKIWWSITRTDRHNTGGFSSGERANGNPYDLGAVETCCTIAWIALSVEMLRLTADARVADELEFSTLNSVTGLHSVTGRWATYDTPADGKRWAFFIRHPWQGREGSPELNCCSVNAARGFGLVSDWALVRDDEGLLLNWYGPSQMTAQLTDNIEVTLEQKTDYPCDGQIQLSVSPAESVTFTLKLRIPRWSVDTTVKVNGTEIAGAQPGSYLAIERQWQSGDVIEIDLDMSLHFWSGQEECAGKTSIYRGPILLTCDRRYNDMDPDEVPTLDARNLRFERVTWPHWLPPMLLLEFTADDGRKLRLCDFGSAGEGGTPYKSWLEVEHVDMDRSQFFAPGSDERLRAEIGRQALMYTDFPPPAHSRLTGVFLLRERWPQFLENCAQAREMIEKDPNSAVSRSLAALLERMARESDIMDPAAPDRLTARLEHEIPHPLRDFQVSCCRPPVADIRQAPPPRESEQFKPIIPTNKDFSFDLNDIHGGKGGLIYLRATVDMPRAFTGPIPYNSDGPVKIWVNGCAVACQPDAGRPTASEEYHDDVQWRQGVNALVFALDTNDGKAGGINIRVPRT